jgi:rod shape determining protein RodA
MLRVDRRLLQNVDWVVLAVALALVSLSAVTLSTLPVGRAGDVAFRQLAWVGVGLVALIVAASLDYRRLVRAAPLLYLLGIAALVAVFSFGRTVSGARRWIVLGSVSVQPSELFKICFVLMAVWWITSRWAQPLGGAAVAAMLAMTAVPAVLIVKQPDLGTALLLVPVLMVLLVGAGIPLRLLGGFGLAGLGIAPLAWLALLKDYQRERVMVFLDPLRDPLGSAYNVIQAKIAIGSGQLLGKGVAGATQSRLAFLPERHTDFIFAVFAERWGFVGSLVLLGCYAVLLLRGFDIAASAREPVGRLVALGATALLASQILVNVGMVTGLLPVVGIPLPLMSYGGSSMLVSLTALGLLLSVRMRQFQ